MQIFMMFLPALGWGIMPILAKKIGGKPEDQLLGTTLAALVFSFMFSSCSNTNINFNSLIFIVGFLSGAFWSIGQLLQFIVLKGESVSQVMPLSNGTQIIFVTLSGGILLNEWHSLISFIVSIVGIVSILIGIKLFPATREGPNKTENSKIAPLKVMIIILISSFSLCLYIIFPKLFQIKNESLILPQAIGMFVTTLVISNLRKVKYNKKLVSKNILTGVAWSIANFSLFRLSESVSISFAFLLSQLAVFISVILNSIIAYTNGERSDNKKIVFGMIFFLFGILFFSISK